MAVHHSAKKLVKAKEQVVLSTGEVMTLGEALDRGLATVGTTEQRALRPKGDRLTVRSYYAEDTNSGELWPISRALFESRTTGTFKPGSPAPAAPTKHVPSSSSSSSSSTTPTARYMVTSYGDDVGYFADLPSAITAADRYQEETDRVIKIFDGKRALSKGEIEAARKASHSEGTTRHHATKKTPAQLQREIDEVLGRWEEDPFGGYRFITTRDDVRFDTAGVDPTYYRDPKWRQRWEFDLKREIEKFKAGKPTKLYKMSATHYRLPGTV